MKNWWKIKTNAATQLEPSSILSISNCDEEWRQGSTKVPKFRENGDLIAAFYTACLHYHFFIPDFSMSIQIRYGMVTFYSFPVFLLKNYQHLHHLAAWIDVTLPVICASTSSNARVITSHDFFIQFCYAFPGTFSALVLLKRWITDIFISVASL